MSLAEYRKRPALLADYLPWAALVAKGVVLNKDGSLQRTARFRGPDLDSATPAELVGTTARLNNALRRLGSGWAIFVEAQRDAANRYPDSRFPDPVSALIDTERRAQFEEEGAHFESAYFLTLCWLPPAEEAARAEQSQIAEAICKEKGIPYQKLRPSEARRFKSVRVIPGSKRENSEILKGIKMLLAVDPALDLYVKLAESVSARTIPLAL